MQSDESDPSALDMSNHCFIARSGWVRKSQPRLDITKLSDLDVFVCYLRGDYNFCYGKCLTGEGERTGPCACDAVQRCSVTLIKVS